MSSRKRTTHRASKGDRAPKRPGRRRRTAGVIAGSIAALALGSTASADGPTGTTEIVHRSISPFATCSGFVVTGEFDLIREITTFHDQDGIAVARIIHADITGTLANAATGESLPTSGVRVFHFDLLTGEAFSTGSNNFVRLPDGGVFIPGAGQLVFDSQGRLLEHHGPDGEAEFDELCAALAT
jgi:hypothetical protein